MSSSSGLAGKPCSRKMRTAASASPTHILDMARPMYGKVRLGANASRPSKIDCAAFALREPQATNPISAMRRISSRLRTAA